MIFPTVTINYMTYTAKRWGQFPKISYVNGATAGSEVVTVDADLNILVRIESGVSTNAQIKAAIDVTAGSANGLSAGDLVSVAITSGHDADVNVTVKEAALAGGVDTKAAARTIGHLIYTAQTPGAAGNNIRVKYTSGASLAVSVDTLDITVQLKNDGSSTNALIKAAIEATPAADALVACSSDGLSLAFVPTVAMAPAFGALSGGLDAAAPSVVLQDLTFASDKTGPTDNGRTISYSAGASAGSEVVTVAPVTGDVNVQIANGVSTAQQIYDALIAESDFDGVAAFGLVTITSYAAAHLTAASPSGVITFGSPADNDTVVLADLPTDGTKTFTKKTATYATGTITVDDYASLSGAVVTVNGVDLTEGAEWTAAVDDETTAASIAAAITTATATTLCTAAAVATDVVTLTSNAKSTAANSITLATSDAVRLLKSAATLLGGYNLVADEFEVIADLTALIQALTDLNATDDATDITVVVVTPGEDMNAATISGTGAYSALAVTFSGGIDAAVVSVNGIDFIESTDWDSITSNDVAAANLAAAITAATATTLCTGNAPAAVITVTANAVDDSGNAIPLEKVGAGVTVSGAGYLTGGIDGMSVTISGTAGTAQQTVNDAAMSGAVSDNMQGFYSDQSIIALTSSFVQFAYPFISRVITIANDESSGTDTLAFSFDGLNIHGTLAPAQAITWDVTTGKVIWLKYINGAPNYRLIVKGD